MPSFIKTFLNSLLLLGSVCSFGQSPASVGTLVQPFDTYRRQALPEKLFVHTDQSFYLTGETLWFKVYYVDGTFHQPVDLSKVAYLELLDQQGAPVLQTKVTLSSSGGNGTFFLPSSVNSGTYRLRAYTNWMKNFDAAYFFEKKLTIVNPFKRLGLPLLRETANYDIQFFPEGGNLVQGIFSKVGFKVSDRAGRGVNVRGWLLNGKNDTLARFNSHKFGIGNFTFTPSDTAAYQVIIADSIGRSVTRTLPKIYTQGYAMRLEEASADQLKITVNANVATPSVVYLLAHTRQVIDVAEVRPIQRETTFLIDKKVLGDGISHLTVFDADRKPVCERLYFKRPTQLLNISLKTDQASYASRTKVALTTDVQASAATKTNQASLSMAVYRIDSLGTAASGTIQSCLWMTSDLPGVIESPEYYWQPESADVRLATDNLMLTHGWRRFRWEDVLSSGRGASSGNAQQPAFRFLPEFNGPIVEGSVTDPSSGKPVSNVLTYLAAAGKPVRMYVSRSDSEGRIRFEVQDFYGPKNLIVQTNPADSINKLIIDNPFSTMVPPVRLPEVPVNESLTDQLVSRSVSMQLQNTYWNDQAIQYRYPLVDSTAFYGKPRESYLLDAYTRFPRMEEVLREYILGVMPRKKQGHFQLHVLNEPYREIFDDLSLVMIDGVPVFDMDKVIEFSPLKIKQIDVVTNRYLFGPVMFNGIISLMTYKNDLAGFPLDPNLLKLEYDGLQLQREFYSPRYDTARQLESRLPDGRTLLYWNPNLQTNATGQSQVEFFTSDQPGTYLIEVNGLSKDGSAGSQRATFVVKNTPK
ncbi:hypothetical protein IC230_30920 [Spirosoma sp. BT704]|uniref:Macroglobulin domain-containing protein n=2 Tax=Spirosoma validum TaxID=2771355 RepID=A0A927B7U2_9BACT|nr:hypothetical protein [Spirosoma validum]